MLMGIKLGMSALSLVELDIHELRSLSKVHRSTGGENFTNLAA